MKDIGRIESWIGLSLPSYYRDFLTSHIEKIIGDQVNLYAGDSVIDRNETYETKQYCPGYIAVGDDSGGRAFLIALEETERQVYMVDQGDMQPDSFELVAPEFSEWVKNGCPLRKKYV